MIFLAGPRRPRRLIRIARRRLLLVACYGLFAPGASRAEEAGAPPEIAVTVAAKGCEPMALTAPAGRVVFVIANKSNRSMEWEILDGVRVVDERENIAPGFTSRLTTRLKPGAYQITCGLIGNPHGALIVAGGVAAKASAADLIGVAAEYRVGNQPRLADLLAAAHRLGEAEAAGDHPAALAAFLDAQKAFVSTAPIHAAIAAQATPLAADLDALGAALFAEPPRPAGAAAKALDDHAAAFAAAAAPLVATAGQLLAGALDLARALPDEIRSAPDLGAPLLSKLEAQRAAVARVAQLFKPYAAPVDPEAFARLSAALDLMRDRLQGPTGATTRTPEQRAALDASAQAVVDALAPLPAALGL